MEQVLILISVGLLTLVVGLYVLYPLMAGGDSSEPDTADPVVFDFERDQLLQEIHDLELDHAMVKLSDEEYAERLDALREEIDHVSAPAQPHQAESLTPDSVRSRAEELVRAARLRKISSRESPAKESS
jgi:hypothetical protein